MYLLLHLALLLSPNHLPPLNLHLSPKYSNLFQTLLPRLLDLLALLSTSPPLHLLLPLTHIELLLHQPPPIHLTSSTFSQMGPPIWILMLKFSSGQMEATRIFSLANVLFLSLQHLPPNRAPKMPLNQLCLSHNPLFSHLSRKLTPPMFPPINGHQNLFGLSPPAL